MAGLDLIGRCAEQAFFMLWDTLWALILGFSLSGAVQAFVSRGAMQRVMGDHRPRTLVTSSLLGMASSSCSYAASALARTLFGRGADFTASIVFMVASTNLVVELGLVLWLLIGWQFALAEFVGGAVMIALLGVLLPRALPRSLTEEQRRHVTADEPVEPSSTQPTRLTDRLRDRERWGAAAGYTLADLTMLRREIVVGFAVAGVLSVAVPAGFWNAVFLHGHGGLATIENAIVGPFVAIISFVCSIGNVPLAAALWKDGISVGGVMAFVFADLISLPLLLIYRKLYGVQLTVRLLGVFWLVMSVSGLVVEELYRAAGILPATRPHHVATEHLGWDHTTILDIGFLILFAVIVVVDRRCRPESASHARDPVCGMQVERANAGAVLTTGDGPVYFCSTTCRDRYQRREPVTASGGHHG